MHRFSRGLELWLARLLEVAGQVAPHERRAVLLAFMCNFVLLGSYYILRPVRDTVATVIGVGQLQNLFTATFIGTLLASPIYALLASRLRLTRLLPGVFWFWLVNVLLFAWLFRARSAESVGSSGLLRLVQRRQPVHDLGVLEPDGGYVHRRPGDAAVALIAAGGSIGAIGGPLLTRLLVSVMRLSGLLLLAAAGFLIVIVLVYRLMREKERLRVSHEEVQATTLDHALPGNPFEGFSQLFKSRYITSQAAFMLLMTWVNTVAYFLQTDVIAHAFAAVEGRAQAIADIDLVVNIATALILIFGLGRLVQRFGVSAGLLLNPLIMLLAFLVVAVSPSLFVIQALQVVRRVSQYAIARPSREICFTVVEQSSRYKAKNVIDTVVYRFGDVSSAWMQAGLRAAGFGFGGAVALGVGACVAWGGVARYAGRRYEQIRQEQS